MVHCYIQNTKYKYEIHIHCLWDALYLSLLYVSDTATRSARCEGVEQTTIHLETTTVAGIEDSQITTNGVMVETSALWKSPCSILWICLTTCGANILFHVYTLTCVSYEGNRFIVNLRLIPMNPFTGFRILTLSKVYKIRSPDLILWWKMYCCYNDNIE